MNNAPSGIQAHNLVNALYQIKCSLETGALRRAQAQADQAMRIAKRLGTLSLEGNGGDGSKRKRGKSSLKRAWTNALAAMRRKKGGFEGIEVMDRIPENFPSIRCHPADLKEILFLLASNAVEAMQALPAGRQGKGRLIIRSQFTFTTKEEPFAVIQVADTGPGIPQDLLPKLFLPFCTTKTFREGNGLGLFLTHQLVRRNAGRITVSSFPGAGTTFTLEFPLAK